jgi:hypothetical protein
VAESLTEVLTAVQSPGAGPCLFRFSASAFDDDDYDRLGAWYDEAAATLAGTFGPPLEPCPRVIEPIDVERVACWRRPGGFAFVLLWWGDNTRVRLLEVGLAAPGTVFAGC